MDNVQYRPRFYHNRTRVLSNLGEEHWLTVPVLTGGKRRPLSVVEISDHYRAEKLIESLRHFYGKQPYFESVMQGLSPLLLSGSDGLVEFNYRLTKHLLDALEFSRIRFHLASDLSNSSNPTQRLIDVCHAVKSGCLVMGPDSLKIHQIDKFAEQGVELICINANLSNPVYNQGFEAFVPGLSMLDLVFREGFDGSRQMLEASKAQLVNGRL